MYEALIFDFDGVILNSEPIHIKACCSVFSEMGITLPSSDYFSKYIGLSDKQMFPLIIAEEGLAISAEMIGNMIEKKIQAYASLIGNSDHLPIVNGLEQFIDVSIDHFGKAAICTGSTKIEVMSVLNKLNLENLHSRFDTMVTSDDVQEGKPSPEGYLLTAKRLATSPDRCLVIEDSPHGIDAAKTAGMDVIALTTTFAKERLSKADEVFDDFVSILDKYRISDSDTVRRGLEMRMPAL